MSEYQFSSEIAKESELLYEMGETAAEWRAAERVYDDALTAWSGEADPEKKEELWTELQMKEAIFKGLQAKLQLLADRYNKLADESHAQTDDA